MCLRRSCCNIHKIKLSSNLQVIHAGVTFSFGESSRGGRSCLRRVEYDWIHNHYYSHYYYTFGVLSNFCGANLLWITGLSCTTLPECGFRFLSQGGTTTLPTILAADIAWMIASATTAGTATMKLPYTFTPPPRRTKSLMFEYTMGKYPQWQYIWIWICEQWNSFTVRALCVLDSYLPHFSGERQKN